MTEPDKTRTRLERLTDALRIPRGVVPHIRRFGWSGAFVTAIVVLMVFGISPVTIVTGTYDPPREWTSRGNIPAADAPREDLRQYMEAVHREARRGWVNMFLANAISYYPARIDFVAEGQSGPCGLTQLQRGPQYCAEDNTVVVDLDAYAQLALTHGESGHLAQAYLFAHAYGAHVQDALQRLSVNVALRSALTDRQLPVFGRQLMLQPHCFAGIWAAWAFLPNLSGNEDVARIVAQAEVQRHGGLNFAERPSMTEQAQWFSAGYDLPVPRQCDPFNDLPSPHPPTLASL